MPSAKVTAFRRLHESGCFVIPNPWDEGTAKMLAQLGYRALATTSAGFAFSIGRPDDVGNVGRDEALARDLLRDSLAAHPDVEIVAEERLDRERALGRAQRRRRHAHGAEHVALQALCRERLFEIGHRETCGDRVIPIHGHWTVGHRYQDGDVLRGIDTTL